MRIASGEKPLTVISATILPLLPLAQRQWVIKILMELGKFQASSKLKNGFVIHIFFGFSLSAGTAAQSAIGTTCTTDYLIVSTYQKIFFCWNCFSKRYYLQIPGATTATIASSSAPTDIASVISKICGSHFNSASGQTSAITVCCK